MEKEIIYNFYINMQAPYKEQFKTLFNMWCLTIFNKTFELTEDNVYTFLCDYFDFSVIHKRNITYLWFNKKPNIFYQCIQTGINSVDNTISIRTIINYIRENI